MAKHVRVVDGVVVQTQPYDETGFIEAPEYVCPGYFWDGSAWSAPAAPAPEPKLLTAYEFKERFSAEEQAQIMTSPELAPLALHVLTAPRGVDVTDETAQQARAALEGAGWPQDRLDAIFAVPD